MDGPKGDHKQGCASMSGGKCVACPGKCPWESHANGDRYKDKIQNMSFFKDLTTRGQSVEKSDKF